MRIDFIITELNVGGAEKALTEIAIGMSQRGHQVRLLAIGSTPVGEQNALLTRLQTAGVECLFGEFRHWWSAFSAIRWLRQQLRANPPALVQTFLFHANCLGIHAGRKERIPHLVGGLRVAESKTARGILERRAVQSMTRLVCVSEQVERFAVSYLRAPHTKCVVIPNGVDAETIGASSRFDWTKLGWNPDVEVALFVGRLHPQKGLELIQQQADRLLGKRSSEVASEASETTKHPDQGGAKRRIVLIGDGPLRASLTEWAEGLGHDRVRILPWQSDIPSFLKASKMLILPSHYEGMPNVVLEAMAAGLPVVCSQIEGTNEIFGRTRAFSSSGSAPKGSSTGRYDSQHGERQHGERQHGERQHGERQHGERQHGERQHSERQQYQLFPVGASSKMAVLVERLFTDPAICERLGNENRRHVTEHFSIGAAIEAYAALYDSLAG